MRNKRKFPKLGLCCHVFHVTGKNPIIFQLSFFLETAWLDILFCTNSSCSLLLSAHWLIIFLVAGCEVRPFFLLSSHLMEIHNSLLFYSLLALVLCHLCKESDIPSRPMTGWKNCTTLPRKPSDINLFFIYFFFFSFVKNTSSRGWLYSHLAHFNVEL